MLKVQDLIKIANGLAAENLAMEWDNSGLQIGSLSQEISNILLSLDINDDIIDEAIEKNCQLIISHHPLLFKPLKKIDDSNNPGKLVYKAIRNDISIFSMHTNLDITKGGINDCLANLLDLNDIKNLESSGEEEVFKLVIYIPVEHFEVVKDALLNTKAGIIGNYSHTSYVNLGEGTFKPLESSNPFIGEKNKINRVKEYRFETLVRKSKIDTIKDIIRKYHPYEEVAYDLYPIINNKISYGLGRIGFLEEKIIYRDYIKYIKKTLKVDQLRYVGTPDRYIRTVAICSGSGSELIPTAVQKGADLLITSDIKYHQAQLAEELGIALIDAGHYQTEVIVKSLLYKYFNSSLEGIGLFISEVNTDPWNYYV